MRGFLRRYRRRMKVAAVAYVCFRDIEEMSGDIVTVRIHSADAYIHDNVKID